MFSSNQICLKRSGREREMKAGLVLEELITHLNHAVSQKDSIDEVFQVHISTCI